jgi:murein DD-endopeptidase MepM/ murein hydrolase activator NlpD
VSEKPAGPQLTVMLVPDGGQESHTWRISYRALRTIGGVASVIALALTVMAGSWWYLAARASRVSELEAEVESMRADRVRVQALGRQLETLERKYGDVRDLFGRSAAAGSSADLWLPPATGTRRRGGTETLPQRGASLPSIWPLTERGFITQTLLDGEGGEHPGLDIAVPTDSYIRAAGGGTVVDEGEDAVYGRFVVIDHGDGYTTLYAHASLTLVSRGQEVREREVIALSGSTGHSTAPHLHFEISRGGETLDPLALVSQPG